MSTTQLLPHLQSHSFPSSVSGFPTQLTTLVSHFLSHPKSNPMVSPSASTTKMCLEWIPSHWFCHPCLNQPLYYTITVLAYLSSSFPKSIIHSALKERNLKPQINFDNTLLELFSGFHHMLWAWIGIDFRFGKCWIWWNRRFSWRKKTDILQSPHQSTQVLKSRLQLELFSQSPEWDLVRTGAGSLWENSPIRVSPAVSYASACAQK